MYQANGLIHSDTNCYSFKKESANIFAQAKKTSEQYRLPLHSASTQLRGSALTIMASRPNHRQLNNHPTQSLSDLVNLAPPDNAYKNLFG
jgi:hypothetical protein